jgi:hypothetical protein
MDDGDLRKELQYWYLKDVLDTNRVFTDAVNTTETEQEAKKVVMEAIRLALFTKVWRLRSRRSSKSHRNRPWRSL